MEKIINFVKENKALTIGAAAVLLLMLFKPFRRVRRRRKLTAGTARPVRRRKVRRVYTKGGKAKKPWQIKGSPEAKRRMARLRKLAQLKRL